MAFTDRREAGRRLAARLAHHADGDSVLVLGLPRGGVPVAYEVALQLRAPLDVFIVRKLGVPGHDELAMGAIASGGVRLLNRGIVETLAIPEHLIEAVTAREREELLRREIAYRGTRPPPAVSGRTVILVDDGLATGATMRAAVVALRRHGPRRLVVAVPVAARETCEELRAEADEIVCVVTPQPFLSVGGCYEDFSETTDHEVRAFLDRAARSTPGGGLTTRSGREPPGSR